MRILLTSGGTKVKIDMVRHIGNMSRGTFGAEIGRQLARLMGPRDSLFFLGAEGSRFPFKLEANMASLDDRDAMGAIARMADLRSSFLRVEDRYDEKSYKDFSQYLSMVEGQLRDFDESRSGPLGGLYDGEKDIVILAAAVSDYLVANYVDGKIRSGGDMDIHLEPAPKVISSIRKNHPECVLVGFKLLVNSTDDELVAAARESCVKNDCAFVVANDLRDIRANAHRLLIVGKDGLKQVANSDPRDPSKLAMLVAVLALEAGRDPQ